MNNQKEIQSRPGDPLLTAQIQSAEKFTNASVNIVVITITLPYT